jgi:hypothetical protein
MKTQRKTVISQIKPQGLHNFPHVTFDFLIHSLIRLKGFTNPIRIISLKSPLFTKI